MKKHVFPTFYIYKGAIKSLKSAILTTPKWAVVDFSDFNYTKLLLQFITIFQSVTDCANTQWKASKARLRWRNIQMGFVAHPPMNLICYILRFCVWLGKGLWKCFKKVHKRAAIPNKVTFCCS